VLLQILDDGRLTDGQGRVVNFKNTIIIMTSNLGSHLILEYSGQLEGEQYENMKVRVLDVLRREFRPEFLNRIDEIIVFQSLTEEDLKKIVDIQMSRLKTRLAERRILLAPGIYDALTGLIAEQSGAEAVYLSGASIAYTRFGSPDIGARPLKRAIQREIETPLSRLILKGEVKDDSLVRVGVAEGDLTFSSEQAEKESGK